VSVGDRFYEYRLESVKRYLYKMFYNLLPVEAVPGEAASESR
jgi:hypothetical protein